MPLRGALQARVMVRYAASFRKLHFNVLIFLTVEGSQVADHVRLTTLPLQCAAYWVALKRKRKKIEQLKFCSSHAERLLKTLKSGGFAQR